MIDQVGSLGRRGIPSTFLASSLEDEELGKRLRGLGEGQYKIVFITPERLTSKRFRAILARIERPLVAIDEAHCISEWGHDFRPEYLRIGELLREFPPQRILACTASATPRVRAEILERLDLDADTPQIVLGFARPNLALSIRRVRSRVKRNAVVDAMLRKTLGIPTRESAKRGASRARRASKRAGDASAKTGLGNGAVILYAATRRAVEAEARRLREDGWDCQAYHAGLAPDVRASVQAGFTAGELNVIVATNAFGMGIDRADVRLVVHLAPPGSIESYYQEVGRAGRGGEPARGMLLVTSQDIAIRRQMVTRSEEDGSTEGATTQKSESVERRRALFDEMMRWAEGGQCRHDGMLRYFGEATGRDGCGRCDVCVRKRKWTYPARAFRRFRSRVGSKSKKGMPDGEDLRHGHRVSHERRT
jgi:ATP-dependent DNA helicase RecQ